MCLFLTVMDGKGQSLEEVEAGIRNMRQPLNHPSQMGRNHHNANQMTAFNDFVSILHFVGVIASIFWAL